MKKSLLALTLIAALPFAAANAQDRPNYNYAQGGYTSLDGDDDVDADGYNLEGSVAVAPNWHIFAGTQQLRTRITTSASMSGRSALASTTPSPPTLISWRAAPTRS